MRQKRWEADRAGLLMGFMHSHTTFKRVQKGWFTCWAFSPKHREPLLRATHMDAARRDTCNSPSLFCAGAAETFHTDDSTAKHSGCSTASIGHPQVPEAAVPLYFFADSMSLGAAGQSSAGLSARLLEFTDDDFNRMMAEIRLWTDGSGVFEPSQRLPSTSDESSGQNKSGQAPPPPVAATSATESRPSGDRAPSHSSQRPHAESQHEVYQPIPRSVDPMAPPSSATQNALMGASSHSSQSGRPVFGVWSRYNAICAWREFHRACDLQNPPDFTTVASNMDSYSVFYSALYAAAKSSIIDHSAGRKPSGWEPDDAMIRRTMLFFHNDIVKYHLTRCSREVVQITADTQLQSSFAASNAGQQVAYGFGPYLCKLDREG